MRVSFRALVLAALLAAVSAPAQAETVRVGGTGGATEMLKQLAGAFEARTGDVLRVIPNLGTGGGIQAAADGLLDLVVAGRPITAQEKVAGFTDALTTRTPYVFVTSYRDPPSVAHSDIAKLYSNPQSTWPDRTPVRIILRPVSESDNIVLFTLFPGTQAAVASARQRDDVPMAPTDQDTQELAAAVPGSFVGSTLTQTIMERRNLRMVPLDDVAPSVETLESAAYPYSKTFYYILPPNKTAAALRFVAFLRSPEGRQALRQSGILGNPE